ncbi:M1 family metallopeptidase [uncultured Chitinophaga sp.]|uniref:M1 family metallopeptidase n=1 Tax=uncultured Chitinophaga sp. TaxID=339340 RepID=UPI0025F788FE|nr:M1 family metallopeptidase [uncultured Chitinophaga sp.]
MHKPLSFLLMWLLPTAALAQKEFTNADTLRGSLTPERTWWDVQRYELAIKPDYTAKSLSGSNEIKYKVVRANNGSVAMQIDMAKPLVIDSVIYNQRQSLQFAPYESVWHITVPPQKLGENNSVQIYYHGKVHEAIRPPWDGGFIFAKDSLGRPYMTVACQGLGASIWYPNKDHQSDEPDKGASLTMTVPDTLVAIGNGRLVSSKNNNDGTTTTRYNVVSPISNYCIIPYIGKYVSFKEVYKGEKGPLDVAYHVLDYNGVRARAYMPEQVHLMFKSMENWFGPYPFYEDGYQLIDAAHTGMEHQSAVSYGNGYRFGYRGRDASGYGWGLKYDFIIIHESGHEWFGNNITTNDLADMWIHEGFTNYSETLFADYHYGKQAGNEYNYGIRKGIRNDSPITPAYNVNAQGSGDMYPKAGNMIHSIRHSLDNDELFRQVLRGLNKEFYHKTVDASQVEAYISKKTGYNYGPVFKQYVTTTQIPQLDYYIEKGKLYFRYSNSIPGFNLPIVMQKDKVKVKFIPGAAWKNIPVTPQQAALLEPKDIEFMYYLKVNKEK